MRNRKLIIVELDTTHQTEQESLVKYSMFIGRWQPWHDGHRWLIDQRLNEGKNVLICVREVSQDDKNPYNPIDVKKSC